MGKSENSWSPIEVAIGTERHIEIYDLEKSEKITTSEKSDYLEIKPIADAFPNGNFLVVGLINKGYPLVASLTIENNEIGTVLCTNPLDLDDELVPIAENMETLLKIVQCISDVWKDFAGERSLHKNEKTMAIRNSTIQTIKDISFTADLSFWDWLAFQELSIGMH